jgi:hypothetical protein
MVTISYFPIVIANWLTHHSDLEQLTNKPIIENNRVNDNFGKFHSKYGGVKRYYPKVDVVVEVPL